MRKRIKAGILALLLAGILMLGGCIPNYKVGGKALIALSKETREVKETLVKNLFTMLNGDSASFLDTLSTNSKVSFENEWEFWQEQVRTYGAYEGYIYKEGWAYGEDIIFCVTASLNGHEIEVDSCWDERNRLKQLVFYTPAEEEEASVHIPDGVEEIEITLGEGTDHPLNGRITKPKQTNGACPAVVLIPGNGSADMDFTAGVTHPYRDIAWGLAEQGIVTIRFDKRVKTYGDEWTEAPSFENLTIDWEFADDAVMALDMLKAQDFVDPQRIFIAGHSLGGLVTPRIDAKADGAFAGYVLLAVPSRKWQDAVLDQFLNYGLANVEEKNLYYTASLLEAQKKDIDKKLDSFSDKELLNEALLGMPANYWKDLDSFDYVAAIEQTDKPVLVLQGGADYQIVPEVDYQGWVKKLENKANCTLKLYDGLNHLFLKSQGCFMGCSKEYDMPGHVPDEVILDIAAFVQ